MQNKRQYEKVFLDIEKNEAKILKKNAEKISEYEENLKQENLDLANQIDIAERHLKNITKTRDKLSAILNEEKKSAKILTK